MGSSKKASPLPLRLRQLLAHPLQEFRIRFQLVGPAFSAHAHDKRGRSKGVPILNSVAMLPLV
jgi:hypothetical protein